MKYSYKTNGTCSRQINFDIDNDTISNIEFIGGCPGNLKAISIMAEGQSLDQIQSKLSGITCGDKNTSCADQLAKAVIQAK